MFSDLQKKIIECYINNGCNISGKDISEIVECDERYARKVIQFYKDYKEAEAPVDENEKEEFFLTLQRQKQNLQDTNRIERATIRKKNRIDNDLIALNTDLIETIEKYHPKLKLIIHKESKDDNYGVLCLSDLHFNEIVDLPENKYDFKIAAKRLHKFVIEATKIFKASNVTNVLVSGLGDFCNSTRRLTEMINKSTNLSKAMYLGAFIIEQLIIDLNNNFNVSYTFVSGNESRIDDEQDYCEMMLSHSWDWNISSLLKVMFRDTNVEFLDGPIDEKVVQVNNNNILFLHGNQIGRGDICKKVQQIKGKYADKGIIINFLVFGHIHESMIADLYARSSSLVGANSYSDSGLQLSSRASQIILIVKKDGIDAMKIDLQNVEGIEGYDIVEELEAYDAKSLEKLNRREYVVVRN